MDVNDNSKPAGRAAALRAASMQRALSTKYEQACAELPSQFRSRWDLLSEQERTDLSRTPCGLNCTGCGQHLETEADFAMHFHVPFAGHPNLGECPHTARGRKAMGLPVHDSNPRN